MPRVKKQKTAKQNQHGVGNTGSGIKEQIHDIHELIEEPATVGLDCNKQMPHNIKQLKEFPAQVERVGKIEWNKSINDDIDNNVATDKGTKMDEKDMIEKKRFENISKQYNKKENNIHDV